MKGLIFCITMFMTVGVYSQNTINEGFSSETSSKNENGIEKNVKEDEKKKSNKQSSLNVDYQFLEGGYGLGFGLALNHFLINGSLKNGETKTPVTKNSGWDIGVGAHYRFWLKNVLFIDADLGVRYAKWTTEYTTKENTGGHTTPSGVYIPEYEYDKTSNSSGNFGLFIAPKIGINIYNGFSLTASYRWDFSEFKFDSDHTGDYFNLGLVIAW